MVDLGSNADLNGAIPFNSESLWNISIQNAPVLWDSSQIMASIATAVGLHPDFGSGTYGGTLIGIPYVVVPYDQPLVPFINNIYASESDPGPFPIPPDPYIQGQGATGYNDGHLIVLQLDQNGNLATEYDFFQLSQNADGVFQGYAATFDLTAGDYQRPMGWTSANAAGVPEFPGLVTYDEVQEAIAAGGADGYIPHALAFTLSAWDIGSQLFGSAEHSTGGYGAAGFGMRFRLSADYQIDPTMSLVDKVILNTLKIYGMVLVDNGSNFFLSGVPDPRWDNEDLHRLQTEVSGSDFEIVDTTGLAPPQPVTVGAGSDSIQLSVSESAYQGNAQFTVSVDGSQVGGVQTVQALNSLSEVQTFTFLGDWSSATQHKVTISFVNPYSDANGARQLTLGAVTYDGATTGANASDLSATGSTNFEVGNIPEVGSGADTLILHVYETAYQGDAQFTVAVNGVQVGGVLTATPVASGLENFYVHGDWGSGQQTVTVNYLNAIPGRQMFVWGMNYDGVEYSQDQYNFYGNGAATFQVGTPTPIGTGADTLVVTLFETAYKGDAQFTLDVDGKQVGGVETVTMIETGAGYQSVAFKGDWGAGAHTVAVNYINGYSDADGGRSLFVRGMTYNGVDFGGNIANLWDTSSATFTVTGPASVDTTTSESAISDSAVTVGSDGQSYISAAQFNGGVTTLTGTAEAGDTVSVSVNGGPAQAATVADDGSWSLALTGLADGQSYSALATATDAAGNTAQSPAFAFTVDTTTSESAISDAALTVGANGQSYLNAAQFNGGVTTLTGTAEAGDAVSVSVNGGPAQAATVADDGIWSLALTGLADGQSYSALATATDAAGNAAQSPAFAFTVDTTTSESEILDSALMVGADGQNYLNAAQFNSGVTTLSGTAEAGDTVSISVNGGQAQAAIVSADGDWTFALTGLADGQSYSALATATDAAGNAAQSQAFAFTVDTRAPSAPTLSDSSVVGGYVNAANDTSSQTLTGTAEAGSAIRVYLNGAAAPAFTTAADTSGKWSVTLGHLADGNYSYTATATDVAGNASGAGGPLAFTVDTQISTPTLSDSSVIGGYVNAANDTTAQTLAGTAKAGSTIKVYLNGAASPAFTTAANSSGNWSVTLGHLADGAYSYKAIATDAAGNAGSGGPLVFTVDTKAPSAPTLSDASVAGGYVNAANDTASQTLAGTAEAGSTIRVYLNLATSPAFTTAADASGKWSVTLGHLGDGSYSYRATATDAAGNASGASISPAFTVDTVAPLQPSITNATLSSGLWRLAGAAAAGSVVTVYDGVAKLGTTTANSNGAWSYATGESNSAIRDFSATATDAAGNSSLASAHWIDGTPGDDIFSFASEAALASPTAIYGNGGSDTIALSAPTVSDADFAHAHNILNLSLTSASKVTLGTAAAAAGITNVTGSSGNDSISVTSSSGGNTITGGGGVDAITVANHSKADTFVFKSGDSPESSPDTIWGFLNGSQKGAVHDKLDFSAILGANYSTQTLTSTTSAVNPGSIGLLSSPNQTLVYVNATNTPLQQSSPLLSEVVLAGVSHV